MENAFKAKMPELDVCLEESPGGEERSGPHQRGGTHGPGMFWEKCLLRPIYIYMVPAPKMPGEALHAMLARQVNPSPMGVNQRIVERGAPKGWKFGSSRAMLLLTNRWRQHVSSQVGEWPEVCPLTRVSLPDGEAQKGLGQSGRVGRHGSRLGAYREKAKI